MLQTHCQPDVQQGSFLFPRQSLRQGGSARCQHRELVRWMDWNEPVTSAFLPSYNFMMAARRRVLLGSVQSVEYYMSKLHMFRFDQSAAESNIILNPPPP